MRRLIALVAVAFLVLVAGGAAADTFAVRLVSQTATTITLGWDPQPGYGYLFSANGTLVSRTNDPSRSTVKFAKADSYDIDVIVKGANGHYPTAPPPPPPPTAKITQSIVNGSTITNLVGWRAVYDGNNDGVEDDPGSVAFLIDGQVVLTESLIPFGDTFADGSIATSNGQHSFEVQALGDSGAVLVTNTVTATVNNVTPPPPPPPGAYPDTTNTGVPSDTVLATYSGPTNITVGNTVIDSKRLPCLTINAPGVVIKNSIISQNCFFDIEVNSGSLTIQDSEINCQGAGSKGIFGDNFVARRVNIHNCEDGLYASAFTLEDSYIHDLATSGSAHNDGIQSEDGSNSVIRHNRIYGVDTSAININNSTGGPHSHDVLIENNLLAGGGWTLYCPKNSTTNFQILNNAFSTIFYPTVGAYGPDTDCNGEIASGNFILETGAPVNIG